MFGKGLQFYFDIGGYITDLAVLFDVEDKAPGFLLIQHIEVAGERSAYRAHLDFGNGFVLIFSNFFQFGNARGNPGEGVDIHEFGPEYIGRSVEFVRACKVHSLWVSFNVFGGCNEAAKVSNYIQKCKTGKEKKMACQLFVKTMVDNKEVAPIIVVI